MTITRRKVGDVTVLDCKGRAESTSDLNEFICTLLSDGRLKVVINFGGVTCATTYTAEELTIALSEVTSAGGQLKLLSANKHIRNLLKITNQYHRFEYFDDEAAAVRSFA